jgi:hypothetical protein
MGHALKPGWGGRITAVSGAPGVPTWETAGGAPSVPAVVAPPAGGAGGVSWNQREPTKKARILEGRPALVDSSWRGVPGPADELRSPAAMAFADRDVNGIPPGAADGEIAGSAENTHR